MVNGDGRPLKGFTKAACHPIAVDSTIHEVQWEGGGRLVAHAGKPVRLRFHLRDGDLYSFWITPEASGASHGYVAAGGPGFTGARDTVGRAAYRGVGRV